MYSYSHNDSFIRLVRRGQHWRLWLIFSLVISWLAVPTASAQADDWIVVQLTQVEVRDGTGKLKLMMAAPQGSGYSGSYLFPSEGTAAVGPGSVLQVGGGIAIRKPTSGSLPVYLSGVTTNQPSPVVEQSFNLISSFISDLLGSRLVDVLRVKPQFLWGWFAGKALDLGFHAVYEAMVINPEMDHALLLLNADNGWLADGQQHTLISANGHLVFVYEVRIARQTTPPTPQDNPNPPASTGINVVNESGRDVCQLYIVPRRHSTWGDNLLGTPLAPGTQTFVDAMPGEVKYRAKDCANNTIAEVGKFTLRQGQTLHIRSKR